MGKHRRCHDDIRDVLKRLKGLPVNLILTSGEKCCDICGIVCDVDKCVATLIDDDRFIAVALDKVAAVKGVACKCKPFC